MAIGILRRMTSLKGKVLIAQGGGPTAVINQSMVGAALEARRFSQVEAVYGALHGVNGVIHENFVDLSRETSDHLERVAATPSSALLSTRDKPDAEYCARMFRVIKKHNIRFFFYIGGNDSSDTVRIVNEEAVKEGYDFCAIHIPKTVDNDLMENDHCPGFGSAAKFVIQAFTGLNLDARALPGVLIGIVMGRHAGFLTASASLARKYSDEGPQLVYVPERPFIPEKFIADVDAAYRQHGHVTVAVSEGIVDEKGVLIQTKLSESSERDPHGNVLLVGGALGDMLVATLKAKLKIKRIRADTFGFIQRSFIGVVSDRDASEAREAGEKAVHFAMHEGKSGSVAIRRPVLNYSVDYELVPLTSVAGKTRHMDDCYLNAEGNGVTEAFYDYCRPLLGSNLPEAHRLREMMIPKLK